MAEEDDYEGGEYEADSLTQEVRGRGGLGGLRVSLGTPLSLQLRQLPHSPWLAVGLRPWSAPLSHSPSPPPSG